MKNFIREHFGSLVFSIVLHGAIVFALVYGFIQFKSKPAVQPAPAQLAIQATVVDEQKVTAEVERQKEEERQKEQAVKDKAEQLKREQDAEQQRLDELKHQRENEEEVARQRVEKRKAEEVERKKEAEAEAKRKSESDAKAEADRKRKADADKKRREDDERKKAADAKQKAEREAELKRRMGEEERRQSAVESGLLAQYVGQIQSRIQRAWIRPSSAKPGLRCVVNVTQVPGGQVVAVSVGECNGDEIVRRSIEAAVYAASPLPEPSDPTLFERNLRLEFKPDE